MTFNPNKPPTSKNKIGTINPNSAEIRKETPESFRERKNAEKGNGVKAVVYKDRSKYDRNTKHKKNKFD